MNECPALAVSCQRPQQARKRSWEAEDHSLAMEMAGEVVMDSDQSGQRDLMLL